MIKQRAYHTERPQNASDAASKKFRVIGETVTYWRTRRAAMIEVSRLSVAGEGRATVEQRAADGSWVAA